MSSFALKLGYDAARVWVRIDDLQNRPVIIVLHECSVVIWRRLRGEKQLPRGAQGWFDSEILAEGQSTSCDLWIVQVASDGQSVKFTTSYSAYDADVNIAVTLGIGAPDGLDEVWTGREWARPEPAGAA